MAVKVAQEVFDGIEAVRQSGATNMLAISEVARVASIMGHEAAAQWVKVHARDYARGIFVGWKVQKEEPA